MICTGNDNGSNWNWIDGNSRLEEFKEQIIEGKPSLLIEEYEGIRYIHCLHLPSSLSLTLCTGNDNGSNWNWIYSNPCLKEFKEQIIEGKSSLSV